MSYVFYVNDVSLILETWDGTAKISKHLQMYSHVFGCKWLLAPFCFFVLFFSCLSLNTCQQCQIPKQHVLSCQTVAINTDISSIHSTFIFLSTLMIIRNVSWAAVHDIRMISEGSCDTEDWSNDAKNSALITGINHILYIHRKRLF